MLGLVLKGHRPETKQEPPTGWRGCPWHLGTPSGFLSPEKKVTA